MSAQLSESQIHKALHAFDLAKVREILATSPAAANEHDQTTGFTPLMVLSSTTLHDLSYYEKLRKLTALGLVENDAAEQVVRNKSLLVIENMAKAIAATPGVDFKATAATDGVVALHMAAHSNNEDLVNLLIDAKADLNIKDATGRTALMRAASFAVRRALFYAGADPKIQDKQGNNVLHYILSKNIPDTPSSSMIARICPELLLVKNDAGRTPQDLAEETVKVVNERAKEQAAADALRPKRQWEGCFDGECKGTKETISEMMKPSSPTPTKQQVLAKPTCWSKFLKSFRSYFCCCLKRSAAKSAWQPPSAIPFPDKMQPSIIVNPGISPSLSADSLIYGAGHSRPEDVLLRSDPVKGKFIAHAGSPDGEPDLRRDAPPQGSFSNEPEAVAAGAEPQPEGVRQTETPPIHRQTNYTSQDEVVAPIPEPTQLEKDMDEVFTLLRSSAVTAPADLLPSEQPE